MIAYICMNCKVNKKDVENNDDSVVSEVALLICENSTTEIVKEYCAVIDDNSHESSFLEAIKNVLALLKEHKVERVFYWDERIAFYIRHNLSSLDWETLAVKRITEHLTNLTTYAKYVFNYKDSISLRDAAYICGIDANETAYGALNRAHLLSDVHCKMSTREYNEKIAEQYLQYEEHRNRYNRLKSTVEKIKKSGDNLDDMLKDIENNKTYPEFTIWNKK